ncbi:MAG: hypothetical protein HY908_22555 [Myxococcales bacterium]|nr:hypothetical protein [Myxococcales bacterium]
METIVDVTWDPTSPHDFLPDHETDITLAGGALRRSGPGIRSFVIPGDVPLLALDAHFKKTWHAIEWTFIRVRQNFAVRAGMLAPLPTPPHAFSPNPLIDVATTASARGGHATIRVRTDFVEVTYAWATIAGDSWRHYYDDHNAETSLVVLAWTRGEPQFWMASIPKACRTSAPGALVFFRPPNTTTIPKSMTSLNRYLLAPIPGAPASEWERRDRLTGGGAVWLRVGIERALDRAGRAVVQFMPSPLTTVATPPSGPGSEFAAAATGALPDLVASAMRLLWGHGHVGPFATDVLPVRRLGLSGFSGGGGGLIYALAANKKVVKEIYAFDADGFEAATTAATVHSWATMHASDMRLRMTAGRSGPAPIADVAASTAGIESSLSGVVPGAWITAAPASPTFWEKGSERWWDYALQDMDARQRGDWATRHQFAVYGGRDLGPGEAPADAGVTWLEEFLRGSGF